MATASQFNRPYAEMPLMAGENSTILRGAGNGLANRAAVPVGGGMTPQRRLDMLSRRAWTQGDMGTVKDLAQSQIYRDMFPPRGGMPAMQRPMMAPPPPSLPALPSPTPSAAMPPPMDSPVPMAPLPIGGTNALQPSMQPGGPPLFALPPSRPGDLPLNPFTTPMPGVSTQAPAQPPFFTQDVNGWNVLGANTPQGPKLIDSRPPQSPPLIPSPQEVQAFGLQPDYSKPQPYQGKQYPTFTKPPAENQRWQLYDAPGPMVPHPYLKDQMIPGPPIKRQVDPITGETRDLVPEGTPRKQAAPQPPPADAQAPGWLDWLKQKTAK